MVSLSRVARPASVPLAVCLLAAVGLAALDFLAVLERPTLLRAGFTLVGAVVALVLFYASRGERPVSARRLPPGATTKVVLVAAAAAVVASAELGARVLPLAVLLPVGFLLVALQIRGEPSVPAVLTQLSALFLAARLAKYVTTGFYFAGTDTFAHVAAVDTLTEVGYTTVIPHGYDLYPVFHFLVGAVTYLTGLRAYDALVLAGIGVYTLVVPIAYLVGASVFESRRLGLTAALGVTLFEFAAYHAVYFYPQALAIVLLFVAVYLNSRLLAADDERTYRRLSVAIVALVATMVVAHHLTYILFAGIVAAAVPVALARPSVFPDRSSVTEALGGRFGAFRYRWLFPGIVGAVFLLAYWTYTPSIIAVGIVELTLGVLFDVATVPGSQLYVYGTALPPDSIARAVRWLTTATGVYAVGLGAVLLLAGYELLDHLGRYRQGFTLAVTGLGLSAILLPLPIPIPQLERLKFTVILVAVFPLAIGLDRALSVDRRAVVVALLLVSSLGTATAFTVVSADDVSGIYTDERREQVAMSDDEYRSVQATSAFVQTYADGPAATDKVTNRAFETTGYNATRALRARPGGLRADAPFFVVRERWTDHVVALGQGLRSGDLNRFVVGDDRFAAADATADKVYTTDHVRVYHRADGYRGFYGENVTANATSQ
ncbi:hypothetical protein [Haloarcula marina]|uniref:hypothetical protein n=1 Tax=Haloarcula marina TaxID=2961574 RepID=UPI0020B8813A|nr:hypothetical protein [Halomicroarcula marina]